MSFEQSQEFCLSRGYHLIDNGDGTFTLKHTEEKKAEVIARNKAIGNYINSEENERAMGFK